ncbi:MAG: T9SS type A sorting domain-containing protein [Bacteroidia bacterium]|nr:T9SS type A sorting domain-containing protein [Bacteroidia bacterium]
MHLYVTINELLTGFKAIAYPNPVTDFCNIRIITGETIEMELIISDMLGRTIYNKGYNLNNNENLLRIYMNNYPAGFYFIKLFIGNELKYIVKISKS